MADHHWISYWIVVICNRITKPIFPNTNFNISPSFQSTRILKFSTWIYGNFWLALMPCYFGLLKIRMEFCMESWYQSRILGRSKFETGSQNISPILFPCILLRKIFSPYKLHWKTKFQGRRFLTKRYFSYTKLDNYRLFVWKS